MKRMPSYVYSMCAVRARLRKGQASVLWFEPHTGRLIKVTNGNVRKIAKLSKRAA